LEKDSLMQLATWAEQQPILHNNAQLQAAAHIELMSLEYDNSVAIRAPYAVDGSIVDQIVNNPPFIILDRQFVGQPLGSLIFPFIPNRFAAINEYLFKRDYSLSHVGYIGSLPAADGAIPDFIDVRFSARRIRRITLRWADIAGRIPAAYRLRVADRYGKILWTQSIAGNTAAAADYDLDIDDPAAFIHLDQIVMPAGAGLRPWLLTLTPSLPIDLDAFDIVNYKTEIKPSGSSDVGIGAAYLKTLTLKIFNIKRHFDMANTASPYYNALRKGAKIMLQLTDLAAGRVYEEGTFYSTDITAAENAADVTIKAACYLGYNKERDLTGRVYTETNAWQVFYDLAARLSLYARIDWSLRDFPLVNFAFSTTLGDTLNELCVMTGALAIMSRSGTEIVVKDVSKFTAYMRYPLRIFNSDAVGQLTKDASPVPNVYEVEIGYYEIEGDDEILQRYEYQFVNVPAAEAGENEIGYSDFPAEWHLKPYDRPIGAGVEPTRTWAWSEAELGQDVWKRIRSVDVTDNGFEYEVLEYEWHYTDETKTEIIFNLWNFNGEREAEDILSVVLIGLPVSDIRELTTEEQIIPMRPDTYVDPDLLAATPEERNSANEAYEYTVDIGDKVELASIKPGNYNQPGRFEFVIEPTATGAKVKVWNYILAEQTFTLIFYGVKIVESEQRTKRRIADRERVNSEGELVESISLPTAAGKEAAERMLTALQVYYGRLLGTGSLTPWRDWRLEIGDRISMASMRGYPCTEGIITNITHEFAGALKQKFAIDMVPQETRDSRCYGGMVFDDRPESSLNQYDYTGGSV
jgi:hypothetical protein